MTDKLTEYKDYPHWIDSITPEEQHQYYVFAKKIVTDSSQVVDDSIKKLAQAVADYELKHNIK